MKTINPTIIYLAVATAILALMAAGFLWAYAGRQDLVDSERAACAREVADRSGDVRLWVTQAWAAERVATDPAQPARTRASRAVEAAALRAAAADRIERVDVRSGAKLRDELEGGPLAVLRSLDAGERLSCRAAHPEATLLP